MIFRKVLLELLLGFTPEAECRLDCFDSSLSDLASLWLAAMLLDVLVDTLPVLRDFPFLALVSPSESVSVSVTYDITLLYIIQCSVMYTFCKHN